MKEKQPKLAPPTSSSPPVLLPGDDLSALTPDGFAPPGAAGAGGTGSTVVTVGTYTLPESRARQHIAPFIEGYQELSGEQVPRPFIFSAGQLFYRNKSIEEVRLAGFIPGDLKADGTPTLTPWSTATPPTIAQGKSSDAPLILLDKVDEGRRHISALAISDPGSERVVQVAFVFDLRPEEQSLAKPGGSLRTKRLPDTLKFYNDAVHGVTVRAFAHVPTWQPHGSFAYAFQQTYNDADVTIGLPNGEKAHSLWEFLRKGGPRMVKAHYALWARYHEAKDEGNEGHYITISVPQFCADIGLKKHQKGGFRPQQKRDAMHLLDALAELEMIVLKTLPNGKKRRLRGPLWARGMVGEENDQFADLFGQVREGSPELWEPVGFSYAPGPWFDDPEWRKYHKFVGKIGAGLMKLSTDTDQWAILIGGYIGTLARVGQYRPLRLRVETILKKTGLAQGADARRRATQYSNKFYEAMEKLVKSETIVSYQSVDFDATDIDDPDDPVALATYGAAPAYAKSDWRSRVIEIVVPFDDDRSRLEQQQIKALEAKRKKPAPGRATIES